MKILLVILLSTLSLSLFPYAINAEEKAGITVAPSIVRLDLSTDRPEIEVFYKNTTKNQIELSFSAQDFSELEEGGRVKFLKDLDAKNYQYSLTSWITFEKQSLTLSPNEGQSIKIFIDKDKLTPGGHYASILAHLKQPVTTGQVPVNATLSTLIFVRSATGSEREELSLQNVSPIQTFLGFPDTFLLRLQNSGNVELIPYGLIEIKDMFGNIIAKGIINEGSLIILPGSVRRFDIPVTRINAVILPGIYNAEINIHFGSPRSSDDARRGEAGKENKNIKSNVSFISQGSINLLLFGLIIAVTVVLWKKTKA